jgi:hypothetical protein
VKELDYQAIFSNGDDRVCFCVTFYLGIQPENGGCTVDAPTGAAPTMSDLHIGYSVYFARIPDRRQSQLVFASFCVRFAIARCSTVECVYNNELKRLFVCV